ncbi:MAG TPA: hypothetical protein PLU22_01175 [Polyangiaceae bacterium]|nr:hypothetical protein [Polyangiaceae bacterium]
MGPSRLSLAALVAVLACSTVACVDNESSLFIRGVMVLESGDCTASPDPGGTMQANGILDTSLTSTYIGALLVGNQLVARGAPAQLRTETARIALRGAEVRVASTTQSVLKEFSVDGTGFVDPASGTSPGYGAFFATLIPNLDNIDRDTVIVNVRVFGRTLGGREVESGELAYPIQLCSQCLISFPPEADNPSTPEYDCLMPAADDLEEPCFFGQDETVDCRLCTSSRTACRAP